LTPKDATAGDFITRNILMEKIYCSLCGEDLNEGDAAYGLTRGNINETCYGFRIDENSEWDIYCPDCMNEIDKLLESFKKGNA
jgi:hypothetical protein